MILMHNCLVYDVRLTVERQGGKAYSRAQYRHRRVLRRMLKPAMVNEIRL